MYIHRISKTRPLFYSYCLNYKSKAYQDVISQLLLQSLKKNKETYFLRHRFSRLEIFSYFVLRLYVQQWILFNKSFFL